MKYLLDTHVILWYLFGDSRLSETAKKTIENNDCFYSYISFWEISIKQSKKKLEFTHSITEIDEMCQNAGFKKLPVTLKDLQSVRDLPFQEDIKHNDPFDRLLICQTVNNSLSIISCDEKFSFYKNVPVCW